jgi:hypothetical protein
MKTMSMDNITTLAKNVSDTSSTRSALDELRTRILQKPEKYRNILKHMAIGAIAGTSIGMLDSAHQNMSAPFVKGGYKDFKNIINKENLTRGLIMAGIGIPTGALLGHLYHNVLNAKKEKVHPSLN